MAFFDLSGNGATPTISDQKRVSYPFLVGESPDIYARVIERDYTVLESAYVPTLATRTTFTNLLTYSEQFDNAAWTKTNTTISANSLANPMDGAVTADSMLEAASTAEHRVERNYTFTAASHTLSVFAKSLSRQYMRLMTYDGTTWAPAFFDLTNGTVISQVDCVASIVAVAPGWFRCSATRTTLAAAGAVYLNASTDGVTVSYAGDITKGLYLWGAMLEVGGAGGTYAQSVAASASVSSPNSDYRDNLAADSGADTLAFLAAESALAPTGGGMVQFTRTYARIPASQTSYGARLIDRPAMNDLKSGSTYAVSFDGGRTSTLFTSRIAVSSITQPDVPTTSNPAGGATPGTLPHVLITYTADNSAQTFYPDDTDATIWAALSSAVSGNAATYASNAYYPLARTSGKLIIGNSAISTKVKGFTCDSPLVTVDIGSGRELGVGVAGIELLTVTATSSNANTTRTVATGGAHSGAAGGWFAAWNGDKLVAISKAVSASSSTMEVALVDFQGSDLALTHIAFATQAAARYANGPASCTVKEVSTYALPGVSNGITTAADIALVAPKTAAIDWLGEIVAASTYAVAEGSQLARWNGWPIYQQTSVSAQMSDALDSVSLTA